MQYNVTQNTENVTREKNGYDIAFCNFHLFENYILHGIKNFLQQY